MGQSPTHSQKAQKRAVEPGGLGRAESGGSPSGGDQPAKKRLVVKLKGFGGA